jgi:hypothetical protein
MRPLAMMGIVALAGCPEHHVLVDACVEKEVTMQVTSPATYGCHQPFQAKIQVTNGSCAQIQIQSVMVAGSVTSGTCGAPGPGTYTPLVTSIESGQTATVLDLNGSEFCCGAPGCPAQFQCDERYTFQVQTSAAGLMQSVDTHLDLGGCPSVCP